MRITLSKEKIYNCAKNSNNCKPLVMPMIRQSYTADSFTFGNNIQENKDKNVIRNLRLVSAIALLSMAPNAQSGQPRIYENSPNVITEKNKDWWNQFSKTEKQIIEQVQNETARVYEETGKQPPKSYASKMMEDLQLDKKHKNLVENLLETYNEENYQGFYEISSEHMSPRAQKLKEEALIEVFRFTNETGKILKFNESNVTKLSEIIGAKTEEVPMLKHFLKSYLKIHKTLDDKNMDNYAFYGDIE